MVRLYDPIIKSPYNMVHMAHIISKWIILYGSTCDMVWADSMILALRMDHTVWSYYMDYES